jgi:hypothetical protein
MQIDLQNPLEIYKVIQDGVELKYNREGVFFDCPSKAGCDKGTYRFYGGKPKSWQPAMGRRNYLEKKAMEIHL